jgi:hypothetical protein
MSLWIKPLTTIAYGDIESFCNLGLPEGVNIDYKADVPSNLPKVVSSFANTTGGLLLIGVETDNQNVPNQICGFIPTRGFSEQIIQICRDNIYPSILPEISPLIELPSDRTKSVAVLRVHQSHEIPHAITNKTAVYVRHGNVTNRYDLADIDRIAWMLDQRNKLEARGQEFIELNFSRMRRQLNPHVHNNPVHWMAVTPLYPRQNICDPDQCRRVPFGVILHRAPNGAFGYGITRTRRGNVRTTLIAVDASGQFFRGEAMIPYDEDEAYQLSLMQIGSRIEDFRADVRTFFLTSATFHPGQLRVSVGIMNAEAQVMRGPDGPAESQYPDPEFTASESVSYEEFIQDPHEGMTVGIRRLHNAVAHGFNLPHVL